MGGSIRPSRTRPRGVKMLLNRLRRLLARKPRPARELDPSRSLDGLLERGSRYMAANDVVSAERTYLEALEHQPRNADALASLGAIAGQQGRIMDAEHYLERALALEPERADAGLCLGNVRQMQGRVEDAVALYLGVVEAERDSAGAVRNLVRLLIDAGRHGDALAHAERALVLEPRSPASHFDLGRIHRNQGRLEEAEVDFRKALELEPESGAAQNELGLVYRKQERWDDAAQAFRGALHLDADDVFAKANLAGTLHDEGDMEAAIPIFQEVLEIAPELAEVHCDLGGALAHLGRFDEAWDEVSRAIDLNPNLVRALRNRAWLLLVGGRLEAGWREHESRLGEPTAIKPRPYPRWDGTALSGKTILVIAEQGIGDEIMFGSCLPDLLEEAKPSRCILEVDGRLTALFARSLPGVLVPDRPTGDGTEWLSEFPPVDVQVPMGSLALYYRRDFDAFPRRERFLYPDRSVVAVWERRLRRLGPGLKVGVSWRGGGKAATRRARSTELPEWKPLFEIPGIHFVNVQYGDSTRELAALEAQLGIIVADFEEHDPLRDMDGFAAMIAALDLVISIDNSTVHVAGAVGTEVWTMLPVVPDWRWMLDRPDTPWYTTMRLYRQRKASNWSEVFARVSMDLERRLGRRPGSGE